MKLCIFDCQGENHIGLVTDAGMLDFSRALQAYQLVQEGQGKALVTDMTGLMREGLFSDQTFDAVVSFVEQHGLVNAFAVTGQTTLRAPIPRPGKIVALGGGYPFPGEPDPEEPPLFFKVGSCVIGPEEPIVYKKVLQEISPELELAVIIGRQASSVPREEAASVIAGYSIFNDVTATELQMATWDTGFWTHTKSIDTFGPLGPYLVPREQLSDPQRLDMSLKVNGKTLLEANTRTMLFDIPYLIEYISTYVTLEPGDVIATGTPGHPGPLRVGDVVELTIAEIGTLRNPVVAEG